MALTLNSTLATAQDSQSRRPLIELISQNPTLDIPFDGQLLTSEVLNEQRPNVISHSSGRFCGIYLYGPDFPTPPSLKYFYTDVERASFHWVTFASPYIIFIEATLCELSDGNIGIIYYGTYDEDHRFYYKIVSPTGASIVADTQVVSYAAANIIATPFVIRLANDTYVLIYTKVDGSNFYIMKRTSFDFQTWSDESALSISGILDTEKKYSPSLLQISTADIFLWFVHVDSTGPSGEELTNIYYSISSDNGSSWGAAVKITDYDYYSNVAEHPIASQKTANQQHLIFNEKMTAIFITKDSLGFCGAKASITDVSYDSVAKKLYAKSTCIATGTKQLYCVIKIDVDTWAIDDCWDDVSVPAFHTVFFNEHVFPKRSHNERNLFAVATNSSVIPVIAVLDGTADTIRNYIFKDNEGYELEKNVNVSFGTSEGIVYTWIDFDSMRLYILSSDVIVGEHVRIGYIDLTQTITPPAQYTYNQICYFLLQGSLEGANLGSGDFVVASSSGYLITSCGGEDASWNGQLLIHLISDGGEYKNYHYTTHPSFPYHGLRDVLFLNGKIYGTFGYESLYDQGSYRGLCEITLTDDTIRYYRPTWATLNEYGLKDLVAMDDGRIIVAVDLQNADYDGATIFNPMDGTWELFSDATMPGLRNPGLTEGMSDGPECIIYNAADQMIYAGWTDYDGSLNGAVGAFSVDGYLRQSQYLIGTYSGGSWSWGASSPIVQGLIDYDLVPVLDPDDSIYGFWTHKEGDELSIKWDRENTEFDLSPYLVRGSSITMEREIGDSQKLTFEISHGHLFDSFNSASLWKIYLQKFRKINLRLGEKVLGSDYWQQMGVFYVAERSVAYRRGDYPTMRVVAMDKMDQWDIGPVLATDYYQTEPKEILEDLVTTHGGLTLGQTNVSVLDDSNVIYHQWIEMTLRDIIEHICDPFGYYPRIQYDGKFTVKKLTDQRPVDHVYSDLTKVFDLAPDDSFSDATNQIFVRGETRDFIEVIYDEEHLKDFQGTMGWWGQTRNLQVRYSDDLSRTCRFPRFQIIESVKDGPYHCDMGREYLLTIDPNEHYFVIRIEGPDLRRPLIVFVVAWISNSLICNVLNAIPWIGGLLAFVCNIISIWLMYDIMQILGTQAGYSYETYARPVGKVRQSFQAEEPQSIEDKQLQTDLGMLIPKIMNEPLCYTLDQAQRMAGFVWMVIKRQRSRITFGKMADLRDEDGDMISIIHPESAQTTNILLTKIVRTMVIAVGANDGTFEDKIEGWVIQ